LLAETGDGASRAKAVVLLVVIEVDDLAVPLDLIECPPL
jgi:hypothetical protein